MEIDRLTPQQSKEYREKGLCYVCGEKGHMAKEHKKEGQSNHGQEDRRNTPGQQMFQGNRGRGRGRGRGQRGGPSRIRTTHQKRDEAESAKEKAENTRTAIRKLILDNYDDPNSDEYQTFVENWQQQGF